MASFYLIRHGQTEWNASSTQQGWQDSPLTESGIAAVELVADQLPVKPRMIFTSDLGRAMHTADIVSRHFPGVHILTDWRLRERAYGDLETKPIDATENRKSFEDPLASYRGSEPTAVMDERLKSFVRDCQLFDTDSFVVVVHNGVLSRFGHLFDTAHAHTLHENSSILKFDIDYSDPGLLPSEVPAWSYQP